MKSDKGRIWQRLKGLPLLGKILIGNVVLLVFLIIFFFLAGVYIYSPAKSARAFYEALYSEDWNGLYDVCVFPDDTYLTRMSLVNARTYLVEQGESQSEEIASFAMKKKSSAGDEVVYTVSYSLKGDDNAYAPELLLKRADKVLGMFYNWQVEPEALYVKNVQITVPKNATLVVDGVTLDQEEQIATDDTATVAYRIPYLFLGGHKLELKEKGKEAYREVFEVSDASPLQFIPELKLNDESGKDICNRLESAVQAIYQAAAAQEDFSKVSSYFSEDAQKGAEDAYDKLCSKFSTKKRKGIATLSITQIASTVTNQAETMTTDVKISYSADEVYKFLFFFYKTKTYAKTAETSTVAVREDGVWVFDENLIVSAL